MREIKFRAWNKYSGYMYSPDDNNSEMFMYLDGVLCYDGSPVKQDKYVLMQYTGLLDKNGKEGYEGDIVNVGENNIYVIEFKHGKFKLYSLYARKNNEEEHSIDLMVYLKDSEIIGNIYENPELIK